MKSPLETIPSWLLVIKEQIMRSTDNGSSFDNATSQLDGMTENLLISSQ